MKLKKVFILSIAFCFAPTILLAHASLTEAKPNNGAVLNQPPASMDLSFTEEVQLLKFSISNDGVDISTDFAPSATEQKTFVLALPPLGEGAYTVNWTLVGVDGHRIEGSLEFSVDVTAVENAGDTASTSHAEHGR